MLTDKDRTHLSDAVGKRGEKMQVVSFCAIPLTLLLAGFKFWMAGLWAHAGGYSLHNFLVLWVNGVSAQRSYSGCLIKAGDDMSLGLLFLGAAVINGIHWWQGRRERERTQRIINALKSAGGW